MKTLLPFARSLRVLGLGPRRFLVFAFFNIVAWQTLVGSVLVLHARAIGLDPRWTGAVASITPFAMILTLIAVPLVEKTGPKRLMMIGWLCRNISALPLVATPFVAARWGTAAAGFVLFAGVLSFCVCRALTTVGWFPWLHELIPPAERGRFLSLEMMLNQLGSVTVGVAIFLILGDNPALAKFGVISAVGVLIGFFSIFLLSRVPGGASAERLRTRAVTVDLRLLARDRAFCRFLFWSASGSFVAFGFAPLSVLYLRDSLLVAPAHIMLVTAVGGLGAMLANPWWGRLADRHGTGTTQMFSGGVLGAALFWLAFLRPGSARLPVCAAAYFTGVVGSAGFFIGSNRGFLHRLKPKLKSTYSAAWLAVRSFAGGLSVNLIGQLLHHGGDWGYRGTCFGYAALVVLATGICAMLPEKGARLTAEIRLLYQPTRPFWSLFRVVWHVLNPPAPSVPRGSRRIRDGRV